MNNALCVVISMRHTLHMLIPFPAIQRREPSMKLLAVVIVAFLSMASVTALAHSGGTDSKGCHRNHKTGDYHCH